jgi:hypothetical protein
MRKVTWRLISKGSARFGQRSITALPLSNLASIRSERALHSVGKIAPDRLQERRLTAISIERSQGDISFRDQRKLQQGHVELTGGWSWSDLVEALNSRVFFWPGDHDGPNDCGRRLFDASDLSRQTVLQVSFL